MVNRCTKAEYGRRQGVSKAAVQKWEAKGWLVMRDGLVDITASDAQLAKYRLANDGRAMHGKVPQESSEPARKPVYQVNDDETPAQAAERIVVALGANMDMNEARRVKENYLALLSQLDYEQRSGAVVAVDVARSVLFEGARSFRDALMHWPGRVAPVLASELDVPADRVSELLTAHVNKLLSSLSDPIDDFSGP